MFSAIRERYKEWLPWMFFLAAAYVPVFHQLGTEPIKLFDESLFAMRAYQLAETGEYLNNFREFPQGPPGTNLKTPLFSVVQALNFKIFGYTEFALRFPVSLMVLVIFLIMYRAGKDVAGPAYSWVSLMVFLSAWGFFHVHGARTGAHDVPIAAFLLLSAWSVYRFVETPENKWIWLAAAATWAAMMTKGIAGAFWLPAIAIYLTWQQSWKALLSRPHSWYAMATVLLLLVGYYAYREWDYPGFLEHLWKGELGGHYGEVRDFHDHPWYWYLQRMASHRFHPWMYWIPAGWAALLLPRLRPLRKWGGLMTLVAAAQLAVVSTSSTKLEWYDIPAYAPIAMIVGALLYAIWTYILQGESIGYGKKVVVVLGLLGAIWAPAYWPVFEKNVAPTYIDHYAERYGALMKQTKRLFPEDKTYTILHRNYNTHELFYRLTYNVDGYNIRRANSLNGVGVGDWIMTCDQFLWDELQKYYTLELRTMKDRCFYARIVAELPPGWKPEGP